MNKWQEPISNVLRILCTKIIKIGSFLTELYKKIMERWRFLQQGVYAINMQLTELRLWHNVGHFRDKCKTLNSLNMVLEGKSPGLAD